jgi:hypothetical protein
VSKRTERRATERANRKLAFQQRQQRGTPAAEPTPSSASSDEGCTLNSEPPCSGHSENAAQPGPIQVALSHLANNLQQTCPTPEAENETQPDPEELARREAVLARVNLLNQLKAESQTSQAQINANRANSQHSTGPVSAEGKATVSQNRRSHGLTGSFQILPTEDMLELKVLTETVYAEYKPEAGTEQRLADSLIRHYWLMQRALRLQDDLVLTAANPSEVDAKRLALFMRYQTTHERSYYKAQKELQNLNKQKQKADIGFESQKAQNEALEAKTRLNHARALTLEVDANCRQVMEAPLPGTHNIPFAAIAKACAEAIAVLASSDRQQAAGHQNVGTQSAAQ